MPPESRESARPVTDADLAELEAWRDWPPAAPMRRWRWLSWLLRPVAGVVVRVMIRWGRRLVDA